MAIPWDIARAVEDNAILVVSVALGLAFTVALSIAARGRLLRLPPDFLEMVTSTAPRPRAVWRTALGVAIAALGVLLLFMPGPGVLLILTGLVLVELPVRTRIVRWLLRRRWALREVNAFRARHGRPPLVAPASSASSASP